MVSPTVKLRILASIVGSVSFVAGLIATQAAHREQVKRNVDDQRMRNLWLLAEGVTVKHQLQDWVHDNKDGTYTSGSNSILNIKVDNQHQIVDHEAFLSYATMTLWSVIPNQKGVLYIKIVVDDDYDWSKLVENLTGHSFFIIETSRTKVITFTADQIPALQRSYRKVTSPENLTRRIQKRTQK